MKTAAEFRAWLTEAPLGDELVYHVGDLTSETDKDAWVKARAGALNALLDEVLAAKRDGRVKLLQKPLPAKGSSEHIARRIA